MELKIQFEIEGRFVEEEYYEYGGYGIYFLGLRLKNNQSGQPFSTRINGLQLEINGQQVYYQTPHFHVCNIQYLMETKAVEPAEGEILFGQFVPLIYEKIPTQDRTTSYSLVVNEDITFVSYYALDFLEVRELSINDKKVDASNIMLEAVGGSQPVLRHYLEYRSGIDEPNIVRTSKIITFLHEGIEKVFVSSSGFYIYPSYQSQGAIKNYIDTLN